MEVFEVHDPAELKAALEMVQPGDCMSVECFAALARSGGELCSLAHTLQERGAELVSVVEDVDTRREGDCFFRVCAGIAALSRRHGDERRREGIAQAKAEGRYKGRRPIAVDETLFDATVALWEKGEITAREAMNRLKLKPNTFYRRIKEREEDKMKEYKQAEKELRQELRENGRQAREAMHDLRKQVKAEAREVKKAAEEKLDLHDVEREMRHDRIRAKHEHKDEVRQLKKDVEAETAELKKLLVNEE